MTGVEARLPAFRWLGAAGFQLNLGLARILVDPFVSRNAEARPRLDLRPEHLEADAIFVTHGHFDHALDVPAIARAARAPVYASISVCAALHDAGLPARQLRPVSAGITCHVGKVSIRAAAARHVRFDLPVVWHALRRSTGRAARLLAMLGSYPSGEVLAYRFAVDGRAVTHFGSAGWCREEMGSLHCDVAMIPLQGCSDIHRVAARMVALLRPRRVIPHHFDSWYPPVSERTDVRRFVELMQRCLPEIEVMEPAIGEWADLFAEPGQSAPADR